MTDDQHGEGTPQGGGRWDPLPQGEYDDGATAFVELPEGGVDALLAADSPLAAPGHGYVPPQITVTPGTTAGTDRAATGGWPVPGAPVDGVQWHDPHAPHQQQGADAGQQPYDPDAGARQHEGHDRFTYNPGSTGQWNFEEAAAADAAPGHDVTGQWSIPVAGGDLPDESGEFTTSSLVEQWGGTPPPTLPGGAPAPWATHAAGQPWGQEVPQDGPAPEQAGPGHPHEHAGHGYEYEQPETHGLPPERSAQSAHAPEQTRPGHLPQETGPGGHEQRMGGHVPGPGEGAGHAPQPPGDAGHAPGSSAAAGHEPEAGVAGRGPEPSDVVGHPAEQPAHAPHAPEPHGAPHAHARPYAGSAEEFPAEAVAEAPAEPAAEPSQHAQEASQAVPGAGEATEDVPGAAEATDGPAEPPAGRAPGAADAEAGPETAGHPGTVGDPATADDSGPPDGPAPAAHEQPPGELSAAPHESADTPDDPAATSQDSASPPQDPRPAAPNEDHPLASYVLRVNGADRPVTDAWIGESLLYVLRERLGLAGAKDGCSQGECGACNVQVDGRLVASCLVPAVTAAGSEVRTVEGLAEDGQPSDVQRALARCGAVQCGFCVPGMAMTLHDLLEGNPAPTELETRQALCGNLCRCSGYRGVVDAVQEVVAEREAHSAPAESDAEEARIPRQAGPGAGGIHPSAFGAPPEQHSPAPHDQPHGQDGGPA